MFGSSETELSKDSTPISYLFIFIYLFNNFIGYVYKLKMNTYTRKETKNG